MTFVDDRFPVTRLGALILLGLAAEAAWVGVARLGDLAVTMPRFQALFILVGAILLTASRLLPERWDGHPASWRPWLVVIVAFAAAFRFTLLPTPPTLSDDVFRYLWEGRLVLAGDNPFDLPPSAEELSRHRDEHHGSINHPEMTTIYPPVAQLIFALSQLISHHPWSMKLLMVIADLALVVVLARLLVARGRHPAWVLLYAWHPLPVVEFAASGHLDAVAILALFAALLAVELRRPLVAAAALAASALCKLFAFAVVPAVAARAGWRRTIGVVVGLSVLTVLPFAGAGEGLVRSLGAYASHWEFNGSVFALVRWLTGSASAGRWLAVAGFAVAALLLPRRSPDPVHTVFVLSGLFVILSPTVHPWYLVWVVPGLCFFPRLSWLYLTVAVVLAYHAQAALAATGVWLEAPWVRLVEYGPFALLLLGESVLGRRRGVWR